MCSRTRTDEIVTVFEKWIDEREEMELKGWQSWCLWGGSDGCQAQEQQGQADKREALLVLLLLQVSLWCSSSPFTTYQTDRTEQRKMLQGERSKREDLCRWGRNTETLYIYTTGDERKSNGKGSSNREGGFPSSEAKISVILSYHRSRPSRLNFLRLLLPSQALKETVTFCSQYFNN